MDGIKTSDYVTGRVEILAQNGGGRRDWNVVCGDGFEQVDAEVVCREMGFDAAKVLAPGSFGIAFNMHCAVLSPFSSKGRFCLARFFVAPKAFEILYTYLTPS